MAKNKIFLQILLFILLINSCKNSDKNIHSYDYTYDSVMYSRYENDSVLYDVICTTTDLSFADSVKIEYYLKGSSYLHCSKSQKAAITKVFLKKENQWDFGFKPDYLLNSKYDLIIIIPNKSDSDYYYLSEIKRDLEFRGYKRNKEPYKQYRLKSYNINGSKIDIGVLNFYNPKKKRTPQPSPSI